MSPSLHRLRTLLATLIATSVFVLSATALADGPARHRRTPNYDGRRPPPPSAGEVLAWIPRVVLSPLYVVTNYGLRAPIGWALSGAERTHLIQRTERLIEYGEHRLIIAPTLAVDLGLATSGGLYFAWNRALAERNSVRVHASTGGPGYWFLSLTDRYAFARRSFIGVEGSYYERADWRYYGLGPDTHQSDEQRFDWGRADVRMYLEHRAFEHVGVDFATGVRWDRFGAPQLSLPPQMPSPPGYENMASYYARSEGFLDTRPYDHPEQSGLRLDAGGEYATNVANMAGQSWFAADASASAFLEVMHPGRVIGVSAYMAMADPLGNEPVPFVNLITLGGFEYMRGWWIGRFRGESATVLTLSYRYPIWYWLDGSVYLEAGNVWGHHFAGFDVKHLFGSAGLGFRTVGSRDSSFDLLIALGSSRFDETFAIDSVRLAFGLNRGF